MPLLGPHLAEIRSPSDKQNSSSCLMDGEDKGWANIRASTSQLVFRHFPIPPFHSQERASKEVCAKCCKGGDVARLPGCPAPHAVLLSLAVMEQSCPGPHNCPPIPKAKTITCWLRSAHDKFLLCVFPRLSKGSVCVLSLLWLPCAPISSPGRSSPPYSFPLAAEEAGGDQKWRRFSSPLPLQKVRCLIKGSSMERDYFSCIKTY